MHRGANLVNGVLGQANRQARGTQIRLYDVMYHQIGASR